MQSRITKLNYEETVKPKLFLTGIELWVACLHEIAIA